MLILTNQIIDNKLIDHPISRIESYIGAKNKIKWKCNICNHIWLATYNTISRVKSKSGCPNCAGRIVTNESIDKKLENRKIKRLDNFINNKTRINYQCLVEDCNYIWQALTPNIVINGHGCPKCAKNAKLTNEEIDNKLILLKAPIIRIGEYINSKKLLDFKCLNCNYIWKTNIGNILRKKSGCPKCAGVLRHDNDSLDFHLVDRQIKRLGTYINNKSKIDFQCELCNNIWSSSPSNILQYRGCPFCKCRKSESLIYKLLINNNIFFEKECKLSKINLLNNTSFRVDFYFPQNNIIVEYNGAQHYNSVLFFNAKNMEQANINFEKQKIRDQYIKDFCIQNNIKLISIDGRKYKHKKLEKYIIEEVIQKYLLPYSRLED